MRFVHVTTLAIAAIGLAPAPSYARQSATPPAASPAPSSPAPSSPAPSRLITGFRSAHFRMTPDEVRRAIAADFPGMAIVARDQPGEGTTVLQVVVDMLDPGPGAATISYVFGATSRTLAQVSVVWATKGEATPDERQAIAITALRLSEYFRKSAQPRTVLAPKVVQPGAVSIYGAIDAAGAGMELVAFGIPYNSASAPYTPTGPASLRLSYIANPANPDVRANAGTPPRP